MKIEKKKLCRDLPNLARSLFHAREVKLLCFRDVLPAVRLSGCLPLTFRLNLGWTFNLFRHYCMDSNERSGLVNIRTFTFWNWQSKKCKIYLYDRHLFCFPIFCTAEIWILKISGLPNSGAEFPILELPLYFAYGRDFVFVFQAMENKKVYNFV